MSIDKTKIFTGAQQSELNAVLMYRKFAELTEDEKLRKIFLEAAADEGKHAAILKKYTNKTLQPKSFQANFLGLMFRILPKKILFVLVSKGEYAGGDSYKSFVSQYPEFEEMMNDEYRHSNTFKKLSEKSEVQ